MIDGRRLDVVNVDGGAGDEPEFARADDSPRALAEHQVQGAGDHHPERGRKGALPADKVRALTELCWELEGVADMGTVARAAQT